MKAIVVFLIFIVACTAKELVSIDEIDTLFKKFILHELSESENAKLQDIFEILRRPDLLSFRSIINGETRISARQSMECLICRSAFGALFEGVANGLPNEDLIESLTVICYALGVESNAVCQGAVGLNLPHITHIIRTTAEATPRAFCGHFFQNAHNPNHCSVDDPRFDWTVTLPDRPGTVPTIPTDPRPFKIAVIADAHIDPLYEAFGIGDCGEPTCCRKGQTPARNYKYKSNVDQSLYDNSIIEIDGELMLDLSVAPKIREQKLSTRTMSPNTRDQSLAGFWGDYRCDSPFWAYDDVIDRIAETHPDIDAVYYVGDTIDHGIWETTYELINDVNRYAIDKMRSTFKENVMVVPVIGNHEAQPTNQFSPVYVTEEILNVTWLYKALVNKWEPYLTEDNKVTLMNGGDFSRLIRPGLRVISLNNNIAYRDNWWLVFDPLDAKKHLNWLVQELYKAEANGEKVHILAHIPPGVADLTHAWTREYHKIINRFSSTVAAEFNGHTHSDQFKVIYSLVDGSPINVAWGTGSATTYTNYNLNYKIVEFNTNTYEPESIISYIYNLTEANLTPHRRPHWFPLYEMKNIYRLNDLSPTSMNDLVYRMTSDSSLLDLYSAFNSKLSDNRWPHCGVGCKLNNLCNTVINVLWEREKCDELVDLYNNNHN